MLVLSAYTIASAFDARLRLFGRVSAGRQWYAAALVAVLALAFDLLFFAVDTLPATVPVAVALALTQRRAQL